MAGIETMAREPRIYIVDDDAAVRDSLQLLLTSAGYDQVVAYPSGLTFLAESKPQTGDCLLLDVQMPDIGGLELQNELKRRATELAVIIMTGHADVPIAVRAMKAGAADFIEKPFSEMELLGAVGKALAAAAETSREHEEASETVRRAQTLTAREREVFEAMISGRPNKVIAHDLGISQRTVEIHRARVMDKMEAPNLSTLVRWAMAAQIVAKRD
jgi:two-component system response regulator FixJ